MHNDGKIKRMIEHGRVNESLALPRELVPARCERYPRSARAHECTHSSLVTHTTIYVSPDGTPRMKGERAPLLILKMCVYRNTARKLMAT